MKQKRATVIGAGIGGLASAIRLAKKGYYVKIFDKSSDPGGKISEFHSSGFRFDKGPSLLTLPSLVDELFELHDKNPRDHFNYKILDLSCKYFWEDGTVITAWHDHVKFSDEISKKTGVSPRKLDLFFKKSRWLYETTSESFLFNSLHKASNFRTRAFMRTMLNSFRLDAMVTMHNRNSSCFNNKKVVQLFDRYATYNGSNPYKTPATLNIIAHLEHTCGTFFPAKGMYEIADSLTSLAKASGVEFNMNTDVKEIIHANNLIKGVRTEDYFVNSDVVVSNCDITTLYKELMPAVKIPARLLKSEKSTSALIFYWAMDTTTPDLELHNILFTDNYQDEFDHLFSKKTISDDPTIYIYISSKAVKEDAPNGKENWYVMVNAPENTGQDWDAIIATAKKSIAEKIKRITGIDIEKHKMFEKIADPRTIEAETGSFRGSLYGISSNNMFSAFNRHPNFRKRFKNLYFSGGSVHPGGGIPLCLASAKIIDKEIE